jgi:hypothetical protein
MCLIASLCCSDRIKDYVTITVGPQFQNDFASCYFINLTFGVLYEILNLNFARHIQAILFSFLEFIYFVYGPGGLLLKTTTEFCNVSAAG